MKVAFWLSLGLVLYTYLGYPAWLYLASRRRRVPVKKASILPGVSVVMAVHNEEVALPAKLENLAALDYPADKIQFVIASDGSDDATNQILRSHASANLRGVFCAQHNGKAAALQEALDVCEGEIVVFVDVRQRIEPQALRYLVANFADPTIGCVSGELMLCDEAGRSTSGLGFYWQIEKKMRQWEADINSTVGATGAFYAVRRSLIPKLPTGTVLDDVFIPLHAARTARVTFETQARVWDSVFPGRLEFRRKVRTLTGNYQLFELAPWILTLSNPILFQFVSHKLCRLLVPFGFLTLLVCSLMIPEVFYRATAACLLASCLLAALSFFRVSSRSVNRVSNFALTFLLLNTAAVVAFINFAAGRKAAWRGRSSANALARGH